MEEGQVDGPPPVMPLRAEPLGYAMQSGRPGLVTAIGVLSVIVASFALLGGLGEGLYGAFYFVATRAIGSTMVANSTLMSGSISSLTPADREAAVEALANISPLSG